MKEELKDQAGNVIDGETEVPGTSPETPPPVDPATPAETTVADQPTNNTAGKKFCYIFDYDIHYANNATEMKRVTVHADSEDEAFALADEQLIALRTDANPITWRYRGTFVCKPA